MVDKREPVIIVGGGAFGLSVAYHLHARNYTDITVFEQDSHIPSMYSSANDLNKIMRVEYEDPWYTDLAIKALQAWKTKPVFAPYFHQVGFLHCASGSSPKRAIDTLQRFRAAAMDDKRIAPCVSDISRLSDIHNNDHPGLRQLSGGTFPGWKGYLNNLDGYTHAANALRGVHAHLTERGVKFVVDKVAGSIREIAYDGGVEPGAGNKKTTTTGKVTGVITKDSKHHRASTVIVAAGAMASDLLPQLGSPGQGPQVVAKSWSVAHVQLTEAEAASLRGIPVVYARDLGFMFEPDPETRLLKICPMGGGYVNTDPRTGISLPPKDWDKNKVGFLPREDEERIRRLLRDTVPHLADRELVQKTMCWFADTSDSDFIIDYVPRTERSLVVLSGDSGHGFKMFPIVGEWAADLLEEGRQNIERWRWKEGRNMDTNNKDVKKDEKWGNSVSWRLGDTKEIAEVRGATLFPTSKL